MRNQMLSIHTHFSQKNSKQFPNLEDMKINRIMAAAMSLSAICACSDLLEKKPLVNLAVENYYTTESEVNTAIMGIYHVFMTENFGLYHYLHLGDNLSDDSQLGNSRSPGVAWAGNAKSLVKFEILPTNNYAANNTWNQDFQVVTNSNYVIENVIKNHIPNSDRYIAEAKFLRSYVYFDMTRQFGGLPIVDHILHPDEYYNPRATEDETWTFVEQGFKDAAEHLPEKWDSGNTGRATRGAALAMLARAYIYHASNTEDPDIKKQCWQNVYDTVSELENKKYFSLEENYSDIFDMDNQNGKEICFSIQFTVDRIGWGDANDGNMIAFYGHDAGISLKDLDPEQTDLDKETYDFVCKKMLEEFGADENGNPRPYEKRMTGWSLHCPTADLVNAFEEGDPRKEATLIVPNEFYDGHTHFNLSSDTRYQSKKEYVPFSYRTDLGNEDNMPRNFIILRYANILLYMAEACNELGRSDEAVKYLEMVRGRARRSAAEPSPELLPKVTVTDRDALREAIWHERRVELAMEYDRFWDLARTGRAASVMKAYYAKYGNDISRQEKGKNFTEGTHEHMPMPQAAIDASVYQGVQTLEQNPGY